MNVFSLQALNMYICWKTLNDLLSSDNLPIELEIFVKEENKSALIGCN